MRLFSPLWIAIRTYSVLPAPQAEWDKENMRHAICFLPVVGILLGGALLLWCNVCIALTIEPVIFSAAAVLLPIILTGGIHMDGLMDTADALGSWQSRERKLEIMKDSHAGASAVLWCAAYLLLAFSLYWSLYESQALTPAAFIFVLSRAVCAASVLLLPNARSGGMLYAFAEHAKSRPALAAMCIAALLPAIAMVLLDFWAGLCGVLLVAAAFLWYRHRVMKEFGGVTGDTSGFFIQICELCLLIGVWIGGRM